MLLPEGGRIEKVFEDCPRVCGDTRRWLVLMFIHPELNFVRLFSHFPSHMNRNGPDLLQQPMHLLAWFACEIFFLVCKNFSTRKNRAFTVNKLYKICSLTCYSRHLVCWSVLAGPIAAHLWRVNIHLLLQMGMMSITTITTTAVVSIIAVIIIRMATELRCLL